MSALHSDFKSSEALLVVVDIAAVVVVVVDIDVVLDVVADLFLSNLLR